MNYYRDKESLSLIRSALKEDIGRGDLTTDRFIPKDKIINAILLAKEPCVICGLGIVKTVFKIQDKNIKFKPLVKEGGFSKKGEIVARISGKAKGTLTAERVALNFFTHLSGIATKTRKYVAAVKLYKVKIMDTRKTIPGLRFLEKYAVRVGGGYNHRFKLDEMILVKDNHLKIIGGIGKLKRFGKRYKAEIEVKNLSEFKAASRLNPDIIMLDNMSAGDIRKAVKIRNNLFNKAHHKKPRLEASGRITLKNVRKIASTGVDMISVGALTHSVDSVDISLEIL